MFACEWEGLGTRLYVCVCVCVLVVNKIQAIISCVADEDWTGSGPLFFYTGNEGPIEGFMDNSGFIFTLAKEFNALVVFAEHVGLYRSSTLVWWPKLLSYEFITFCHSPLIA